MAAEDVGKPLAQPRRRTPDHPPYAMMIDAAIQSLSEKGGSSIIAISHYIRSNYDNIPDGHDRLLPYYLSKLTAQGEFIMTAPGHFAIADDACTEPTPASSRLSPTKPASSSKPIDNKDDDPGTTRSPPPRSAGPGSSKSMVIDGNGFAWMQPKPMALEGDIVKQTESLAILSGPESGHPQSPSDGKTMPSQGDTVKPSEYVLALPWEGPPVTTTAKKSNGSKPVQKRRGCPPKNKAIAAESCSVGSVDLDQDKGCKAQHEPSNRADGSNPDPKRRGRPPKKKDVLIVNSRVGSDTGDLVQDEREPISTRAKQAGTDSTCSVPKHRGRGRPPKRKWNS